MSGVYQQLHLPIELERDLTFEEYLPGPNAEAVGALSAMAEGAGEPYVYVFGGPGTGKTHLLQAACIAALACGLQARYLPLSTPGLEPSILDDLERLDLIALDDLHVAAGGPRWERALFDLFNRVRERDRRLLLAAGVAPDDLRIELPDLASRLHWGPRYRLQPLTDADCESLLLQSAKRRGLRLKPDVVRYIMSRHARDPGSLMELTARLDSLSLREQRQPTIPLVRRAMSEPI